MRLDEKPLQCDQSNFRWFVLSLCVFVLTQVVSDRCYKWISPLHRLSSEIEYIQVCMRVCVCVCVCRYCLEIRLNRCDDGNVKRTEATNDGREAEWKKERNRRCRSIYVWSNSSCSFSYSLDTHLQSFVFSCCIHCIGRVFCPLSHSLSPSLPPCCIEQYC